MGGKVSTPTRDKVSSTIPVLITSQTNVYEFVTKNINNAFSTLKDTQNYMGSNCYSLLHTLTQAQIKSDEMSGTDSKITPVLHAGITKISDVFPRNYYKMFQIVLNETKSSETDLDETESSDPELVYDEKIRKLLENKQYWIRNPSQVINTIIIGFPGVRDMVALGTISQAKTIGTACVGAGGADTTSKCMSDIFKGASRDQKERCCICGLGKPPELTDIEHVVSSQLLILLGICPAPKSWAGFWEVFNALGTSKVGGNNWVMHLISFFPEEEGDQGRARNVFRSMMLPAHSQCNRHIKSEWSPIGIKISAEQGGNIGYITADINESFDDMNKNNYVDKVIIPSIDFINDSRKKFKLNDSNLDKYKKKWIGQQKRVFSEIAWLLNSIDQRNNTASLGLIKFLYVSAAESRSDGDRDAFVELVSDLLGSIKGDIAWSNIHTLIYVNTKTQLIIMTKLTLVVEALLVVFQSEVQDPVKEYTYGSPDRAYKDGDSPPSSVDSKVSPNTMKAEGDEARMEMSYLSPAQVKDQKRRPNSISLIRDDSDNYDPPQYKLDSDMFSAKSVEDTTSYANVNNEKSTGMDYDNEFMNGDSKNTSNSRQDLQGLRVGARPRPKTKKSTDINMRNRAINDIASMAVRKTYGTTKLPNAREAQITAVARNAAHEVLINQELHNNKIPRNARYSALDATLNALKSLNNDSYSPGLGGGSRKRKYTTRGRRSTRKRRPSKKPRCTIGRQRRNNKRTQKRRK
jgi:hypothetical protein